MATKWDILQHRASELREQLEKAERELRGLEATPCGILCDCGVMLETEADFAKHFIIPDTRYLNLGYCPNIDRCELCGERFRGDGTGSDEQGEFARDTEGGPDSIIAHAQCGLDAGLEIA